MATESVTRNFCSTSNNMRTSAEWRARNARRDVRRVREYHYSTEQLMPPDNREGQMQEDLSGRRPRLRFSAATWIILALAVGFGFAWKLAIEPKMQLRRAVEHEGVGQPLPVLELAPLTGASEGLSLEKLRGKVALVNFWGTWCPPCNAEFPHMVELWEEFRGNPEFALVSVSCTQADKEPMDALRQETAKFLAEQG